MRVVMSGASGLIGASVVTALRARGDDVTPLVRRPPGAGEARWDPAAGSIDSGALEGADAVVHLAGAGIGDKRWSATRRHEIVSSRVQSTSLLARSLAELNRPPTVLVSASAVGFYGDRGDEELTEASGARARVPGRAVPGLGGRHRTRHASRHPGRPSAFRGGPVGPRWRPGAPAPPLPARGRGAAGKRPAVVELDLTSRRGRRRPPCPRRALLGRPRQRHGTDAGHQP